VEFFAIYIVGPLLILHWRRPGLLFLALWVGGSALHHASKAAWTSPIGGRPEKHAVTSLFARFAAGGALLTLVTRFAYPHLFLSLPREHPLFWLVIMGLYPVLSVWPQEVIYRRFLFHRYRALFGEAGLIAASALVFGFGHIIFLNGIAVALTIAGGAMFAQNYARNRSLALVCLEHSLYGCLVFTIGLGRFFYTGAAWHH
jgi:membrane protease YdiL (CAAX protease family)